MSRKWSYLLFNVSWSFIILFFVSTKYEFLVHGYLCSFPKMDSGMFGSCTLSETGCFTYGWFGFTCPMAFQSKEETCYFPFTLFSVEQAELYHFKTTCLQVPLSAWFIYFLSLSWLWGREVLCRRGSDRCVHSISTALGKIIETFVFCFEYLLHGIWLNLKA